MKKTNVKRNVIILIITLIAIAAIALPTFAASELSDHILLKNNLPHIDTSKIVFGYARVSTKEQNIQRQIDELRKYVPNNENILIDYQSGKNFERPQYKRLKDMVRSGEEIYVTALDRLGRNKKQIKDELDYFRKKGIRLRILNIPTTLIDFSSQYGSLGSDIFEMVNNILIEVLGTMAEQERKFLLQRQAEGLAVWRRTRKTKTGKPYGRPKIKKPKRWDEIYAKWRNGEFLAKEAMVILGLKKSTFYVFAQQEREREKEKDTSL